MREQMRWLVMAILLSALLSGCGGNSIEAIDREITALDNQIPSIDVASAKAFSEKAHELAKRINALPVKQRKEPGDRLEAVCRKAQDYYWEVVLRGLPSDEFNRHSSDIEVPIIYGDRKSGYWH